MPYIVENLKNHTTKTGLRRFVGDGLWVRSRSSQRLSYLEEEESPQLILRDRHLNLILVSPCNRSIDNYLVRESQAEQRISSLPPRTKVNMSVGRFEPASEMHKGGCCR